jgi:hypothetical protein
MGVRGGRSLLRWLTLPLIPSAFALSVWSAVNTPRQEPRAVGQQVAAIDKGQRALVPRGPFASIAMTKTVGTVPAVCAATTAIIVPAGTTVHYCYEVTNTGTITLTRHDLVDSELGQLLTGHVFPLGPADTTFVTQSTVINVTTVNTATWTAYNLEAEVNPRQVTDVATSSDAALVVVLPTATATPTNTATDTPTPTSTPTPTGTATATSSATPSNTATATSTGTATPTVTGGPTISVPVAPEIPTLSEWGVALLALLLGAVAALLLRRR